MSGEEYQRKLRLPDSSFLPDPYLLPKMEWINDPSLFPAIGWPDICDFLIYRISFYTKESIKAYKSLEAYNYFTCGHVQTVFVYQPENASYKCLRADVLPSQRQGERAKMYDSWVYVDEIGGILSAHCTCMAGSGSACSHVAAILFKVEASFRLGMGDVASTSKLCEWNAVSKSKVTPSQLRDIDFQRPKREQRKKKPVHMESVESTSSINIKHWEALKDINPNAVIFTSLSESDTDSETDTASETEDNCSLPSPLTSLYDFNASTLNIKEQTTLFDTIFTNLTHSISDKQVNILELKTRQQRHSDTWYEQRAGRITASNFHRAVTMRDSTKRTNFIKDIIQPGHKLVRTAALRWGIDMEDTARGKYTQQRHTDHDNFVFSHSGLVVNCKYPYLGASPDGVVSCKCCGKGSVEIKCPFKYRDGLPQPDCFSKDFCLDKNCCLKETHSYYYQVQGQMFILDVKYCDFFVWTPLSNITTRVYRNDNFITYMLKKLNHQYRYFILPELVTRSENCSLYDEVRQYCTCNRPSFGPMIGCDGKNCQFQWFHYSCVGITKSPPGKWFCPACKQKLNEA